MTDSPGPNGQEGQWEIQLGGDSAALELLKEVLTSGDVSVTQEDDKYILRSSDFDALSDARAVRSLAEELEAVLAGSAKLILGWDAPVTVKGVSLRRPDGTTHAFIMPEPVVMKLRTMPATITYTRADGTEVVSRPGDPAAEWIRRAREDPAVRQVLRLISAPNLGWVELYRIYDAILAHSEGSISQWVSEKQIENFRRTANSVGAVGDEARHGRERGEPPQDPIALKDARALTVALARSWLSSLES